MGNASKPPAESILKRAREARGFSQIELARRAKVAPATAFRAERGDHVKFSTLKKLAAVVGLPAQILIRS